MISISILNNIKHLLKGNISELNYISTLDNYWKIHSIKRSLSGFELKRLPKYNNGIEFRLSQVMKNYGYPTEFQINKDEIIIDIGANIGEFSVYCLEKGAKVLSIEPDEQIRKSTIVNVGKFQNSLGILNKVVSNKTGVIDFYLAPSSADSSLIEPEKYNAKVKLPSITLNDLFDLYNFEIVKLIKCDAEGGEPEVLSKSEKALQRTKIITLNCGPERYGKTTVVQVEKILKENNFTTKVIDGYKPKTVVVGVNKRL